LDRSCRATDGKAVHAAASGLPAQRRQQLLALDALMSNEATLRATDEAGSLLGDLFKRDGRVFSCGNGGSMCDAMHFAEELSGCVANDWGYEHVFSRYIEAHARSGDVLVAISTSGNVLAAVRAARQSA
jgi:D-sedoheptulose 7-phosphate isomerase